ncbi:hypothetical protein LAV79_26990 [Peribacillus butanolivorans]|uniref:hypothetical protein n=1 Tax=Peribacillus butanolivorans TaxID=421767 RepID=UPI0030C9B89C
MKTLEIRVLLQTFSVAVAISFYFWANYLTNPIEGKSASDLSKEIVGSISSSISGIFKEAVNQSYEVQHTSFNLIWNLGLPFILFLIVTTLLGTVCFHLSKSIFTDSDSTLDIGIKCITTIGLAYVTIMSGLRSLDLLILNFAVAAISILIFIILLGVISAPFSNNSKSS